MLRRAARAGALGGKLLFIAALVGLVASVAAIAKPEAQ
jgi:hypothetical protein